jgi:hypothetical protein
MCVDAITGGDLEEQIMPDYHRGLPRDAVCLTRTAMSARRGQTAIIGIGEVPTGRLSGPGAISFALESAREAIADAGIDKDEIDFRHADGHCLSFQFSNELATGRLVEELGLKGVVSNCQVFSGRLEQHQRAAHRQRVD